MSGTELCGARAWPSGNRCPRAKGHSGDCDFDAEDKTMGRVGRDRKALLRGLAKYNALQPSPMHISKVEIRMTETTYPLAGDGFGWVVSYGDWHGYGDTIMGAANDVASRMPTVVAS